MNSVNSEYTCVNSGAHTHTHALNSDASFLHTDTEETMNYELAAPVRGDDNDECDDHGEGGGIGMDSPAATNLVCHFFME